MFPLNDKERRCVCARHQGPSKKYVPRALRTELHDG
jgi:hypothetical protein